MPTPTEQLTEQLSLENAKAVIGQDIESLQTIYNTLIEFGVNYSFQFIGALLILVVGMFAARWLGNIVTKLMSSKQVDVTLTKFLTNVIRIIILTIFVIIALGKFGLEIGPLVAAIGALSLGAGLAFQGLLSNYVAGFTIILTRPFVVGNTITLHGYTGVVEEVKLAYTILITEDGEMITIPNKHIIGEILENSFEYKIVELSVGISYSDEPAKAVEVIRFQLKAIEEVTQTPPPQIGIEAFADSSINIGVRYWVPTQTYYESQYKVNLAIFNALKEADITIPFPQRDVRVVNVN